MTRGYHPLVKQLLEGERSLADLPPELRAEGEEALRLLGAVDRAPATLSEALDQRVMAEVRRRAAAPGHRAWQWLTQPRDVQVRFRIRPWTIGALAAAAAVALLLARPAARSGPMATGARDSVWVKFVLYAPEAQQVAVAGTFNGWDPRAAPLVRTGTAGVWTTTLALPVGQHQYTFVVDGERWVADPAAPSVGDGFGRRNSVIAVSQQGARVL